MGQAQSNATAEFITNLVTQPDKTIGGIFTSPESVVAPMGSRIQGLVQTSIPQPTPPAPTPPAPTPPAPPPAVGNVGGGGPEAPVASAGSTRVTKARVDKAINENNRTQLQNWLNDPNVDFMPPSERDRIFQFLNPNAPRDKMITTAKPKGMPTDPTGKKV